MKRFLVLLAALLAFAITAKAQEPRSYTEGAISVVTSVKILDGQFDNYMNYLDQTYKSVMEAQKKAGTSLTTRSTMRHRARRRMPISTSSWSIRTWPASTA